MKKNLRLSLVVLICFLLFVNLHSQDDFTKDKDKIQKYFKMSLKEMMEVEIITAGRTPEKVADIPASVVLITREDIETYGYKNLAEILENIPGLFAINDYGEGGINFGVRGFWSGVANDNMIIMVNGVSQVHDLQNNYPLTKIGIPIEAIDGIEVIRGPMSVVYGNGAFYGVINIFTNDALKEKMSRGVKEEPISIVSTSYGSDQTKKIFLRIANQKGDFNYVFNASISDTYGIDQPLNKMVRNPALLPLYGVTEDQTTGGRLESSEKYFNFSANLKGFYVNLSYIEGSPEFYFLFPSVTDGNAYFNNNTNISFGYNKKLSDKITLDGRFSYFQSRTLEKFDFLFSDFYGIQQFESNAYEVELNAFIYPSGKLDITTGLYYRAILNTSSMYDLPSFGSTSFENNYFYLADGNNIETRAVFTQLSYKPFSKLNLVAGVRLEQMPGYDLEAVLAGGTIDFRKLTGTYEQDNIEVIPRLAAIFSLNDKNVFKLLYGMAINRPSFFQNTKNSLNLDTVLVDFVKPLKPEKINTLEINYIGAISSKFTLSTSIFRNELENLITRVVRLNDEGNYQSWSGNAGKMITYGVELTIKTQLFKNFRLVLSGTYQETEDKRPGYENIVTAYSPNFLGYIKAAYRTKKFTLAFTGNYVDGMETYWDETIINPDDGSTGDRIGDKVEGYFLLGANVRIDDLFFKGLYLSVRCSNLLDEEVRYPTFTNNDWATRGTLGSGRTFLLSIGWKF
ncbi:MAG: TonB-dependent receptor [Candidatus Aminicenantes bacterium]|nr:TonB-dependent receptor [Candidatus Aminicenantes bacterium]